MSFFSWLESTPVSIWVRETPSIWAFPFILFLHTLGLALIAGLSSAVALAIVALPERLRQSPLVNLFPLMWVGLAINAVSGVALLVAYPAKALTNPVFYIKLIAIGAAVWIVHWLQRQYSNGLPAVSANADSLAAPGVVDSRFKTAAWSLIGLWIIATLTGRLLAYTHSILLAGIGI